MVGVVESKETREMSSLNLNMDLVALSRVNTGSHHATSDQVHLNQVEVQLGLWSKPERGWNRTDRSKVGEVSLGGTFDNLYNWIMI